MKEGNRYSQFFGSSPLKPVGLRSYLTNWCKKMHFLKGPLYNGRKHSDTWSADFDALFSYWSILLFVLILIVRRVKSWTPYMFCVRVCLPFCYEEDKCSVMCSGGSGEGPPLFLGQTEGAKKHFETGPLPPPPSPPSLMWRTGSATHVTFYHCMRVLMAIRDIR